MQLPQCHSARLSYTRDTIKTTCIPWGIQQLRQNWYIKCGLLSLRLLLVTATILHRLPHQIFTKTWTQQCCQGQCLWSLSPHKTNRQRLHYSSWSSIKSVTISWTVEPMLSFCNSLKHGTWYRLYHSFNSLISVKDNTSLRNSKLSAKHQLLFYKIWHLRKAKA